MVDNIQEKFDQFSNLFNTKIKLFPDEEGYEEDHSGYNSNRQQPTQKGGDSALRFSFEKSLRRPTGFANTRGMQMNALQEATE